MIYKADIFLFFACFLLLDLCLPSRSILMFDLATYPAISLSLSKFNLTITTNITNQGKKYIGQKKKKKKMNFLVCFFAHQGFTSSYLKG